MKTAALFVLVFVYWLLHQDFWFWAAADPLLFGFLPPGLWYHGLYTIGIAGLMAILIRYAWPHRLERESDSE